MDAFEIKEDGLDRETSGLDVLKVDGKEVTSMRIARTVPLILQWDETFDVGADPGTPGDDQELSSALPIHGQAEQTDLATRATCSERGGPGDSPRESAAEQRGESIAAARDAARA